MSHPKPPHRPRILVVDDEPDLVTVLRLGLEAAGFEVIEALDGETGLKRAREDLPDLLLLDLMLPGMDGYKVCRLLKHDERFRHIPILILSARTQEKDRKLAIEMGADGYFTKPCDGAVLVNAIRLALRAGKAGGVERGAA